MAAIVGFTGSVMAALPSGKDGVQKAPPSGATEAQVVSAQYVCLPGDLEHFTYEASIKNTGKAAGTFAGTLAVTRQVCVKKDTKPPKPGELDLLNGTCLKWGPGETTTHLIEPLEIRPGEVKKVTLTVKGSATAKADLTIKEEGRLTTIQKSLGEFFTQGCIRPH
jgi:hypothetical protein